MGRRSRTSAAEPPSGPVEHPPAEAGAGRESRASETANTLGELVATGIDALLDIRTELREVRRRLDQLAAATPQPAAVMSDADDYSFGRDRDPGDAVPPGVATTAPTPLTGTDEAVLHTLEELPKRTGRGRRGPRAKA